MALFPREEIEAAFLGFIAAAGRSGRSGDWSDWGSCMTPDATFVETELGRFGKREAIVTAITNAMPREGERPWGAIQGFPVEEYVIDDNRGWVWALVSARFKDPGDGSLFQGRVFLQLKYHGEGRFYYLETIYNPYLIERAMDAWLECRAAWEEQADERMAMLAAREEQARKMAPLKIDG